MPTRNRGKQPNDDKLFAAKWIPVLTEAADDLCFLMSRGYAHNAALQVVGNRYRLNKRQRTALFRISSSRQEIELRHQYQCSEQDLVGEAVAIDGFNLLILLEGAISGAYIFKARDGTCRDISSVHGSYKRVRQTEEAILLVGKALKAMGVASVTWYLDKPISNSGRLLTRLYEISEREAFGWEVSLVNNPDKVLAQSEAIVISSDGWILDQGDRWFNLGAMLIERYIPGANMVIV
jgi:hypothetical protein